MFHLLIYVFLAVLPSINSTDITLNFSSVMLLISVLGLFIHMGLWVLLLPSLLSYPKHWQGVSTVRLKALLCQYRTVSGSFFTEKSL